MKKFAALLTLSLLPGITVAADKVLYFYNWSEYMPEDVLDAFEKETGIEVKYTTYDSNEAMYAKLRLLDAGNSYDLVIPSTYYVSKMRKEGLLKTIDSAQLKGFDQLDPRLVHQPFDPDNSVSVPYLWGTTGMAINTGASKATISRWADLWNPEFKGRIMMTNDMREVFHVGLRVLGYSGNSTSATEIEAAYEKLKTLQPAIRTYNSDAPRMPYIEGETDVGMMWNGEGFQALEDLPTLKYVYPAEGAVIWMDSFVIPKNARHPDAALAFINFTLRPEIAKIISENIGYATPNLKSRSLLDADTLNNRTIYPTDADLKNAEFQSDVGEAITVYEKYWTQLKAGRSGD
jgi:spermidine/putrescine transport system substrate-binding protein